jgi:lipoprotein signal peptidase
MTNKMELFKIIVLIAINLIISILIQSFDLWRINNYNQELFRFGWLSFAVFLAIGFGVVVKLKLLKKYPLFCLLIVVGVISNILEKSFFGYVTDYLNFGIGVANLADLEIYLGCICIIVKESFSDTKSNQV